MMGNFIFQVIILAVNILNVLLHSFGMVLLVYVCQTEDNHVQQLFLINLAMSEVVNNSFYILTSPLLARVLSETFQLHVALAVEPLKWIYYTSMLFVALDRLLASLLPLTYPIHCDRDKIKYLLLFTWLVGLVLSLSFSILALSAYPYDIYIGVSLTVMYMVFVILFVVVICRRFKRTRRRSVVTMLGGGRRHNEVYSSFQMFRSSYCFIPSLLLCSFFVLVAIPDLLFHLMRVSEKTEYRTSNIVRRFAKNTGNTENSVREEYRRLRSVLHVMSDTIDALIYLFMKDTTVKLIKRLFSSVLCCRVKKMVFGTDV